MPVYEYICDRCEKVTEEMQKFSDAPLTDCEACGEKGKLRKLISRSSFALKGTGWYTTDYKKSSAPKAADPAAPKAEASPTETKSETKTESKSETKTESKPTPKTGE